MDQFRMGQAVKIYFYLKFISNKYDHRSQSTDLWIITNAKMVILFMYQCVSEKKNENPLIHVSATN